MCLCVNACMFVCLNEAVYVCVNVRGYVYEPNVPVVEKGIFGAHMHVSLINDGPFTIVLDSRDL